MTTPLGLFGTIGWQELLIVGIVMLLLFGRRLPEVGRSLGQGITQFKKGLKDVTDDIDYSSSSERDRHEPHRPLSEGRDRRVSQSPDAGRPAEAEPVRTGESSAPKE